MKKEQYRQHNVVIPKFKKPNSGIVTFVVDDCNRTGFATLVQRYIEAGVLDKSSFAQRIVNKYPSMQVKEGMIKEIDTSRYLQSMFTSFSFYYQCALNYSYMRIRNFI